VKVVYTYSKTLKDVMDLNVKSFVLKKVLLRSDFLSKTESTNKGSNSPPGNGRITCATQEEKEIESRLLQVRRKALNVAKQLQVSFSTNRRQKIVLLYDMIYEMYTWKILSLIESLGITKTSYIRL
jgi:hypothetical protein